MLPIKISHKNYLKGKYLSTLTLALGTIIFIIAMVIYPKDGFKAALNGIQIWFNVVFPALLPFFIVSNLMLGSGFVHFMGIILEPIMRPIFRLPGVGAFVVAMGYSSGFPIGAILTTKLRKENLISQAEGQRLLAFTNNSSPLFIISAVAVGMLNSPQLGIILLGVHYASNLCVGLLMRFYGKGETTRQDTSENNTNSNRLIIALREMHRARIKDGRPFGKLMGDSVIFSINNLLTISGFIVIFSVLTRLGTVSGLFEIMTRFLSHILTPLGVSSQLLRPIISGIMEITTGTNLISQTSVSLEQKLIVISWILGWSGLSIQAQVASVIDGSDLRMRPFILARILHGTIAAFFIHIVIKFYPQAVETSANLQHLLTNKVHFNWLNNISFSLIIMLIILGILLKIVILFLLYQLCRKIKFAFFHYKK